MDPILLLVMRIAGFILAGIGLFIVFAAPKTVDRKGLAADRKIDPGLAERYTPEEQEKYKREMAILDVKLRGLLFAAPGFILILIAFS